MASQKNFKKSTKLLTTCHHGISYIKENKGHQEHTLDKLKKVQKDLY